MAIRIFLILAVIATLGKAASIRRAENNSPDLCTSQIYCQGNLLKIVQLAEIFNDSKTFVDMSQKNKPQNILAEIIIERNCETFYGRRSI